MKPIRVGIVGSKFAANFHCESFRQIGKLPIEIAGVYSPTTEHREAFAKKHGITSCESFENLLDRVDVVDVCCPGFKHETCAVQAAKARKHVIVEKPFTGAFGPANPPPDWRGNKAPKEPMLQEALASSRRMIDAAAESGVKLMYAENWVFAPAVQKEVEILKATKGQIVWAMAEESHSGSHSPAYGVWSLSGGGSLMGKGCHPLTAILYLKRVEGAARLGRPIRPAAVSCRVHELTRNPAYASAGFLRTDYRDVEDYCQVHVVFDDGFVADIFSSEVVMGGVHNWVEVYANNHRMRCNINPNDSCTLYNPREEQLKDVYIAEKLGTKQGWNFPSPDENWQTGYPQELEHFMQCVAYDREPESGGPLGADTVSVLYASYLSAERKGAETPVPLI